MWLISGKTSLAMLLASLSATVAVAAPLNPAITTPAIRKRFHMLHHSEGGRSSFMACLDVAGRDRS
jgi:hypothetical protein